MARSLRSLLALLAMIAVAPVSAAHAAPDSDCFPITREIRELQRTRAQLRGSLDSTTAAAKPEIEKRIAAVDSLLAAKSAESDECWYTIHVHAVRVSDCCAGARPAPINPDQVARWIAKANEVYAAARVRFEFDPTPKGDWGELNNTDVNNLMSELPGDPVWERGKAAGNELASHFPDKVLLLFRHGPDAKATGGGFSSNGYNFVVMPGFDVTTVCGPTQNAYLLAHEMGHYFGLKHTFRQFKTRAEAMAALKSAGNKAEAFDGDGLAETPPEPYIEELQCGTESFVILNGIPFALLRKNIMSYYAGEPKTLTPQQVGVVRAWMERRFATAKSGTGPFVPDERRSYQIVWPPQGKTLEVAGASKANGAAVGVADWIGAPNQAWRAVPLSAQDAGLFEIVSVASGKCLTIDANSPVDGARVTQREWGGYDGQKWWFRRDEPNGIVIEAKRGRMVLSLAKGAGAAASRGGARDAPGTLQISPDKGDAGQRWKLLPLD